MRNNNEKQKSIRTKILLLVSLSILIFAAVFLFGIEYSVNRVSDDSSKVAEEKLLEQVKESINIGTWTIAKSAEAQYESAIAKNDGRTKDQIVSDVLDNIRRTLYSESGYYFVIDYEGTRLVAPENLAAEGQNMLEVSDENGVMIFHELIQQAQNGGGFVSYMWENPNTGIIEQKISYSAPLKLGDYEVLVGTGAYLPIIEQTKAEIAQSSADNVAHILKIAIPLSLLFILIILVVMLNFFTKKVIKPLKTLDKAASELANGNLSVELVSGEDNEIGRLTNTLDGNVRDAFKRVNDTIRINEKLTEYRRVHVNKIVENLSNLASGELMCNMTVDEGDEDTETLKGTYESISENLHLSIDSINDYISEIAMVLELISAGDLRAEIESEFKGDFKTLRKSINDIAESLNGVVTDIQVAANQVAVGTSQISEASQTIAQGATEQAGAIQELSETIREISSQSEQNAQNARRANELSEAAKNDAFSGNENMKDMQQAMTEINDSAESIGKIIKVIDNIAFQTKILALNASVEAARAGTAGKGFAVVANEVSNLAASSAEAAKETALLIEESIQKVQAGTDIADKTAKSLEEIVEGIQEAVSLVAQIDELSQAQATAVLQVTSGVAQMSTVVQSNSATAEEAAAASEELASQADMLKKMMARFTLRDNMSRQFDEDEA